MLDWDDDKQHHPFCNFLGAPREGWKMCVQFYKDYPMDEIDHPNEMIIKHFPEVAKENNIK